MVIPNFFITFVRHSFHTSHSLHIPSRERRHRPAPFLPPGATPPSRHTHCLTHYAHATASHTAPRKGLCHTRHAHATHPCPHSTLALRATTLAKGCATRATHTLRILALTAHTPSVLPPPRKGLRHAALPPSMKATLLHAPTPRKFSAKKARAP